MGFNSNPVPPRKVKVFSMICPLESYGANSVSKVGKPVTRLWAFPRKMDLMRRFSVAFLTNGVLIVTRLGFEFATSTIWARTLNHYTNEPSCNVTQNARKFCQYEYLNHEKFFGTPKRMDWFELLDRENELWNFIAIATPTIELSPKSYLAILQFQTKKLQLRKATCSQQRALNGIAHLHNTTCACKEQLRSQNWSLGHFHQLVHQLRTFTL